MKDKVFIEIEKRDYGISVGFSARRYGAGSPCDNEEEVKESIKSQSRWIMKEGDIPMIRDLRIKQKKLI